MAIVDYFKKLDYFKGKPFSMQDARDRGISRSYIRKWLSGDVIERIAHGVYKQTSDEYGNAISFIDATSVLGWPSVVCLLSALEFYNLTDQIAKQVWMRVSADKRTRNSNIRLFRSRNPLWKIGMDKHEGFQITSIERTLVDCLLHKKILGSSVAMEAMREALRTKQSDLSKIIKMAKLKQV